MSMVARRSMPPRYARRLSGVSPSAPIALIVNIVGIALMMPVLMEAMQTGDFTSILGEGATITAQPSGGSGNAWG